MLWDEWRGSLDGRPAMYIKRLLCVTVWPGKHVRLDLHKIVRGDDLECFHTHPAYAVRVILRGGYLEEIERERFPRFKCWRPLDIGLITPRHCHRIETVFGKASYSLWLRGPICADIQLRGNGWPESPR